MKWILPANATVAGIIGLQEQESDLDYRISSYSFRIQTEGSILLYHTLTGELGLLSGNETETDNEEELIQHWFYVPEKENEYKRTDEVRRIIRLLKPAGKGKNDFTILTTTDCNARCFYCYEMGITRMSMTPEKALEVALYMIDACHGKKIRIRWFGGEPLFNREAIEIICGELNKRGIEFESSMVSNGYYMDEPTCSKAYKDWNLKKIQITLDGTESEYNRIKAYTDACENPYQRVMSNIEKIIQTGIDVTIRMNMDARNAGNLLELSEEIAERFQGKLGLKVYVAPLHEFSSKIHPFEKKADQIAAYHTIQDKLRKAGIIRKRELDRKIRINCCMADDDNSEIILPDGRTGRCEHYCEEMITGNIHEEKRDEQVIRAWKKRLKVPECRECVLYPICVKLEKCEWNKNGCNDADREVMTDELREQVLNAYYDYQAACR